jgi:hypothetical protein
MIAATMLDRTTSCHWALLQDTLSASGHQPQLHAAPVSHFTHYGQNYRNAEVKTASCLCVLQPANLGLMNSLHLQGVAWFGFNNGATMVDGLYGGYQNASIGDFPTVLKRMKLLGFNGLRLPFIFADLDKPPSSKPYVLSCLVSKPLHPASCMWPNPATSVRLLMSLCTLQWHWPFGFGLTLVQLFVCRSVADPVACGWVPRAVLCCTSD